MSLELSPEVESVVREQAAVEGISVNDLLARTFAFRQQAVREEATSYTDPATRVQMLLDKWQAEDNTPLVPSVPTLPNETPTQALFRKWKEEDALMSEEEKEAEDSLWKEIEQDLLANRLTIRTKQIAS